MSAFPIAGTGGPPPNSTFKGCDGQTYKRNGEGGIPDEVGKDHQRITNAPGTLSMANTGMWLVHVKKMFSIPSEYSAILTILIREHRSGF